MVKIGLLPLDNRPPCYQFPQILGKIANVKVLTPPNDILGNFTCPANIRLISEWLLNISKYVDGIIVSIDMLAYGGLFNSRRLTLPYESASKNLAVIKKIRKKFPKLTIYAFSILMRSSISVSSSEELKYWEKIQHYLKIAYKKSLDKKEINELTQLKKEIPNNILTEYFKTRARNHKINKLTIQYLADGLINFLVIPQEDTFPDGPQKREKIILNNLSRVLNVEKNVMIYPGADESAMVLLSRFLCDRFNLKPSVYVDYASKNGANIIALYEDCPLTETVQKQISACGGTITNNLRNADIIFFVNTPIKNQRDQMLEKSFRKTKNEKDILARFVQRIKDCQNLQKELAIADVFYANGADNDFITELQKHIKIYQISSFAAWNTAGNTIGTAIAHSVIRWVSKKISQRTSSSSEKAHYQFLISRFLDDWGYQTMVRPLANKYATDTLNVDIWNLGKETPKVEKFILKCLKPIAFDFFKKNFPEGSSQPFSLKNIKINLPWPRTFEINIQLEIL